MSRVPFNKPYATGRELGLIDEAIAAAHLSANGPFGERCRAWLEERLGTGAALLVNSGTAALEAAMLLADVGPGDEVIMPSYTYVSSANAVALRGATPVFVDIREDTLNLDEALVEQAMTGATKAIVAVHYAGVACELDALARIAQQGGAMLIEDAAQGLMASWRGRPLGTVGALGAVSFHETKNVTCGEGGALLVNDPELLERAEVVREKGTNRAEFRAGRVDRYEWVGLGSSYELSDLAAAFLWGQLQEADAITAMRQEAWDAYHRGLEPLESDGLLRRPVIPEGCLHNAHLYHVLAPGRHVRDALIAELDRREVDAVFHYVPLHSSPAGRRYGRVHGDLSVTDDVAGRVVRLPLWAGLGEDGAAQVVAAVASSLRGR